MIANRRLPSDPMETDHESNAKKLILTRRQVWRSSQIEIRRFALIFTRSRTLPGQAGGAGSRLSIIAKVIGILPHGGARLAQAHQRSGQSHLSQPTQDNNAPPTVHMPITLLVPNDVRPALGVRVRHSRREAKRSRDLPSSTSREAEGTPDNIERASL
jgi:hypothetical protein